MADFAKVKKVSELDTAESLDGFWALGSKTKDDGSIASVKYPLGSIKELADKITAQEQVRSDEENKRVEAESGRVEAEQSREQAEENRETASLNAVKAAEEAKAAANTAKDLAESSANSANAAASLANYAAHQATDAKNSIADFTAMVEVIKTVVAENIAALTARVEALEGLVDNLGEATAKSISVYDTDGFNVGGNPLVVTGHGVPFAITIPRQNGIPAFVGQMYIDIDNAKAYIAVGTKDIGSWIMIN